MRKEGKWERAKKRGKFIDFSLMNSRRNIETLTQLLYKQGEGYCERGQNI